MKTDSIYYQLFLNYPRIFFELIGESPETVKFYEFTSRELKDYSFRLDGLFWPRNQESGTVFYVVEVQSQPDEDLYYRIFGEFFTFLRQYKPQCQGRIVVIYPSRSIEIDNLAQFDIINPEKIIRIYLDELENQSSLGIGVIKLVITPEKKAVEKAKELIQQTKAEITSTLNQRDLIDLIETIIVYKLPKKTREEIENMLGLSELKQTKVYQEAFAEGEQLGEQRGKQETKLEAINRMLKLGVSSELIAQYLDLPVKFVKEQSKNSSN